MSLSDKKSFLLESGKGIKAGKTRTIQGIGPWGILDTATYMGHTDYNRIKLFSYKTYLTQQHIWGTQIITESNYSQTKQT